MLEQVQHMIKQGGYNVESGRNIDNCLRTVQFNTDDPQPSLENSYFEPKPSKTDNIYKNWNSKKSKALRTAVTKRMTEKREQAEAEK